MFEPQSTDEGRQRRVIVRALGPMLSAFFREERN
jgi:hypothetical protein